MKLFLLLASWMPAFVMCATYSNKNQNFICVTIISPQEIPRNSPYQGRAYNAMVIAGTDAVVAGNKITVRSDFWELEPGKEYWLNGTWTVGTLQFFEKPESVGRDCSL